MERDELQEYLNALGRSDCYRIDAVLKDSAIERTERVFFVGSNGSEFGPFIRKIIANESGQGRVYEKLYRAQQAGKRFAHLPRIYECYSTDSSIVVVIEFIQGETLQQRMENASENRTSGQDARDQLTRSIFPALCDAVSELHEAFDPPIIHRDLTPANIIVSEGNVTLIDLGIARTFHPDAQRDTTYFGTRNYAPPEQFGFGQTDVRSDVYAMGKVLQFCLVGGGEGQFHTDPELSAVIAKATQLDPAQRFQSVADLKAAFLSATAPANPSVLANSAARPLSCQAASVEPAQTTLLASQASAQSILPPPPQGSPVAIRQQARHPRTKTAGTHGPSDHLQSFDVVESANRKSARGFLALIDRIPRSLGIVWDVFVVLFWLLIFVAANAIIVEPTAEAALYPTWFLIVEYYGMIILPCTIIAYFLLDLRILRARFPNLKLPTRRKALPFAILAILALVIAVVAIANYAGLVPPSAQ